MHDIITNDKQHIMPASGAQLSDSMCQIAFQPKWQPGLLAAFSKPSGKAAEAHQTACWCRFVHQWVAPGWLDICFGIPLPNLIEPSKIIGIYGVLYALPAWCAFTNTSPMLPAVAVLSTILFSIGSAINISADLYKTAQKEAGVKKVTSHLYDGRLGAHPNYVGDWMRYSSFAIASGSFWAWVVPAFIVYSNLKTARQRSGR